MTGKLNYFKTELQKSHGKLDFIVNKICVSLERKDGSLMKILSYYMIVLSQILLPIKTALKRLISGNVHCFVV